MSTVRLPAEERRASLLSIACGLFARRSYRGTTTAEIARAAGVTEPVLYRHFASKRALYLACMDWSWEQVKELWAERLAAGLNARRLPGVHFRPAVFEPTFQKHARTTCGGCQIHVTDRRRFLPVLTGVALIEAIRAEAPTAFAWRPPPYEYEHDKQPIDILAGSPALREALDSGARAEQIAAGWPESHRAFLAAREACLLYH